MKIVKPRFKVINKNKDSIKIKYTTSVLVANSIKYPNINVTLEDIETTDLKFILPFEYFKLDEDSLFAVYPTSYDVVMGGTLRLTQQLLLEADLSEFSLIYYDGNDKITERFVVWFDSIRESIDNYNMLLKCKASKQEALSLLPLSIKQDVILEGNSKDWLKFSIWLRQTHFKKLNQFEDLYKILGEVL